MLRNVVICIPKVASPISVRFGMGSEFQEAIVSSKIRQPPGGVSTIGALIQDDIVPCCFDLPRTRVFSQEDVSTRSEIAVV